MKAAYWINSIVSMLLYSTLMFLGAGTIYWSRGWLYIGSMALLSIVTLSVLVDKPRLLKERFELPFQKGQKNEQANNYNVSGVVGLRFLGNG